MELEKMIELLENVCNVEYNIEDFGNVKDLIYYHYIENEMFTQEELDLVIDLLGYNLQTLNDILYARYGYRDLEQMLGE